MQAVQRDKAAIFSKTDTGMFQRLSCGLMSSQLPTVESKRFASTGFS